MPRKKAVTVKKYKTVQAATKARKTKGSVASRKVSTTYSPSTSKSPKIQRGPSAGGPGSLGDLIIRTINGIKVPINGSSSNGKKKKK